MDVSLLMTSPLARGLFRCAIAQSGAVSVFKGSRTRGQAEELGQKMAAELKLPAGDTIARLRKLPPGEILEAAKRARGGDRTGLETSVDGWVLPKLPTEAFAAGESLPAPLLIGSTAQEIGGNEPAAKVRSAIQEAYGGLADRALALYGLAGTGEGKPDTLYGGPGVQWPTDVVFRCPVVAEAVAHAAAGPPTYQYGFDHAAPDRHGNQHGMGQPAVGVHVHEAGDRADRHDGLGGRDERVGGDQHLLLAPHTARQERYLKRVGAVRDRDRVAHAEEAREGLLEGGYLRAADVAAATDDPQHGLLDLLAHVSMQGTEVDHLEHQTPDIDRKSTRL